MNTTDAAKILGLHGDITPHDVKKAYRAAALKYHPDKNPAGAEMMKIINAAFDVLKDFQGNIEQENTSDSDYGEAVNQALNAIINFDGLIIEICGAWLWVSGKTFIFKAELKDAGFRYASKKKCWYFRPEDWASKSRGSFSMDDIRSTYGSIQPNKPSHKSLTKNQA